MSIPENPCNPKDSKILFIGHSWVNDIEKHHLKHKEVSFDITFNADVSGGIDELLHYFHLIIKPEYSHIILLTLFEDGFSNEVLTTQQDSDSNEEYGICCINKNFDIEAYVHKINELSTKCYELNPEMFVVVLIPPCVDLNYYNISRLENYPAHIVDEYRKRTEFSLINLHSDCVQLYNKFCEFKYKVWFRKTMLSLQMVSNSTSYQQENSRAYLTGKVNTLEGDGLLRDGFHPSDQFISIMWQKLIKFNLLSNTKEFDKIPQRPNAPNPKKKSLDLPLKNPSPKKLKTSAKTKRTQKNNKPNEMNNRMGADAKRTYLQQPDNPFSLKNGLSNSPRGPRVTFGMNADNERTSFQQPENAFPYREGSFHSNRGPPANSQRNLPIDMHHRMTVDNDTERFQQPVSSFSHRDSLFNATRGSQGNLRGNLPNDMNNAMAADIKRGGFQQTKNAYSYGSGLNNFNSPGRGNLMGQPFPDNRPLSNRKFDEEQRIAEFRGNTPSFYAKGSQSVTASFSQHPKSRQHYTREYDLRAGPSDMQVGAHRSEVMYPPNVGNIVETEVIRMMARLSIALQKEGYDFSYKHLRNVVIDIVDKHDQL